MKLPRHAAKHPGVRSPKRYTTIIILLIIVVGIVDAIFVGVSNDLRSRSYLAGRAATLSTSIAVSDVKALKGDERADLKNPAYQRIKQRLGQLRNENHDIRFAYLMGRRPDGTVFFYADSESPLSGSYSPPGQVYHQASPRLLQAFQNKSTFNEGPRKDDWGIWISSLAPVVDQKTDEIVGVAGIDIPARDYYMEIILIAAVPLLLAAIPVAGLLRDRKLEMKEWEIATLKSQFVSIASHELRSPLSGMLWAIQSLLEPNNKNLTADQQTLLQAMYRSTESSVATINEILDLSIFERGKNKRLEHEPVDILGIMEDVQNTLRLGAQEKQLDIVMAKTWPESAWTEGDMGALKRAFMNILSNAIKYSFKSTTITITYRRDGNQHIIGVLDQGIGVPKEDRDKVFGGYYRATNATKMQAHGTGLGLFVTKLIIEQHHGKVWIESEEGRGTTVLASLPAVDPTKKPTTT